MAETGSYPTAARSSRAIVDVTDGTNWRRTTMTTNVRDLESDAPCHAHGDGGQGDAVGIEARRVARDDRVAINWRPSTRQLTIVGVIAALVVVVGAALVFNVGAGNLG